jgi:hypothetical protein
LAFGTAALLATLALAIVIALVIALIGEWRDGDRDE